MYRILGHDPLEDAQDLQGAGPPLVNIPFLAYLGKRQYSLTHLTEVPDHLILVILLIAEFEIAFESFSEGHLHGADHASPPIIALNFLNALPVGEPEDVSIHE